jgi:AraC-like DNA-binding protein
MQDRVDCGAVVCEPVATAPQEDLLLRRDACHDDSLVNRDGLRAFVDACQILVGQVDTTAEESTILLRELLIRVLRRARPSTGKAATTNYRVTRALDYLEDRFSNTALDLASAARHVDVTPSHLDHLLKEHTGLTFLGHLRQIRMRHAEQLLMTARSVKETSYLCGYAAVCSFGRDFKRTFGCAPRVWRDLVSSLREPIN